MVMKLYSLHVCALSIVHHKTAHRADLYGWLHIEGRRSCEQQGKGSKEHHGSYDIYTYVARKTAKQAAV